MDSDVEIEDLNEYSSPDSPESEAGPGFFFFKILGVLILFGMYYVIARFSASLGSRVARRTIAEDRDFEVRMREARRRLQEKYDDEKKRRMEQKANKKQDRETKEEVRQGEKSENTTKRVKTPDPKLLRPPNEYFPLMGDTSSSKVCFRRPRAQGG